MTRVVAIVQARMGSSRLPAKVLVDIAGESMLARVVHRLLDATSVDEVCVATTTLPADDAVADAAAALGVGVYRGSSHDVLSRYHGAASVRRAEQIVRVTADCPLLDAGVVDAVVAALTPDVDYASNTHRRTFPRGLDVEAFHKDTLARIARLATTAAAREHVTSFLMEEPSLFRTRQVCAPRDDSDLRWTVDTPEDLAVVRELAAHQAGSYEDMVAFARRHPVLATANAHIAQTSWEVADGRH